MRFIKNIIIILCIAHPHIFTHNPIYNNNQAKDLEREEEEIDLGENLGDFESLLDDLTDTEIVSQHWKYMTNPSLNTLKEKPLTSEDCCSLEKYLTITDDGAIPLPQCVIDLIKESRKRYKEVDSKVRECTDKAYKVKAANPSNQLAPCGGKRDLTGDKIKQIFGISENDISKAIKANNGLKDYFMFAEKAINELFNTRKGCFSKDSTDKKKKVFLLGGVPVSALSRLPSGYNDANSIAMIPSASRYNTLEGAKTLADYFYGVQGEQCVAESLALGALRVVYVESQANPEQFSVFDKFDVEDLKAVKKFYCEGALYLGGKRDNPTKQETKQLLEIFQRNKHNLQFYAQWCPNDTIDSNYLLYLLAAPAYNKAPTDSNDIKLCKEILEGQYEAAAKLAVILAAYNPSKKVNLHLTLVGGGVFNNPRDVIYDSIKKAIDLIPGNANINVYIHAFDSKEFIEATTELQGTYSAAHADGASFLILNKDSL